ncbi:MAG: fibronectin type III domain-containing protein, partial [Bacteroidales bacterium]|nr:fibronectin type III domain-containing protein [Bacteroidales bacterium]
WTIGMTEQGEPNLNSLFITDGGGNYSYTTSSTSAVYAYCRMEFTELLNYNISFDWQCNGESTYDYLRAFLVPTSANPDFSAGTEIANGYTETPDGWIDINNGRMNQAGREWMHADKTMIIEPGLYYLVFYWRNDDGAGDNPPAAVDNIVITKISCPSVTNIAASDITIESATLTWTEIGSAESWDVIVSGTELTDNDLETYNNYTTVSSPSYSATELEQAHTYYIYVRAACSSDEKSRWTSGEFSSAFCAAEDMCEIRYELEDSYGDGWNDNTLNVVDASTDEVLASWTIEDGSSASGTLAVCDGRDIRFEYAGDNYPDETSYKVYDVNGDLIFEGSDKFTDPIHYMMSCSSCLSVNNLMATGVNDESATISWGDRNSTGTWEFIVSDQNLSGPELDGATVQTLTDSTYSLSGLTPTTIYYVYVRSVCSAEEKSGWKSLTFRTTQVPAQIPYSYGFEDESENAIWTLNVGASNGWSVGEAAYNDGSKGLYVSNDNGASNSYDTGSETSIYAYRTLNVPELCYYSVSFDWMAKGESDYDYLRVFMVPTSLNADLSSGVQNEINVSSTPANWIELYSNGGKMNDSDSWQTNTIEVALEQGLYNLVFYWRNDNGGGEIPPAAIDNISVTKLVPFRLSAQVQPGWGSTAATLEGNINFLGEVQTLTAGFEFGVDNTHFADSVPVVSSDGTFSHEFTGLEAQTIYYYRAFVIYNDEPVYSDIAQFKTRNNDNGTESSPLIIESETDWGDFVAAIQNGAGSGADAAGDYKGSEIVDGALGMYFKIGNDITLTSSNITVNGFKGILLGDGKTITLDNSAGYGTDFRGLFSSIYNATIDSLNISLAQSITIPSPETSDNNGFGLLCSEVYSSSVISDCTISGGEGILLNCNEARFRVGALVGSVNNATITNCTNNLDVDGYYVAGIAGLMKGGTISKCTNNAAIKSETEGYYVGGIVYSIEGNVQSTITECL